MKTPDLHTQSKNAIAIDAFIIICLVWGPLITPGLNKQLSSGQQTAIMMLGPVYLLLGDSVRGRSIGKLLQGVAVFDQKSGARAGFFRCLARSSVPWVAPAIVFAVGNYFESALKTLGKPFASATAVFLIGLVAAGFSLRNRLTATEVKLVLPPQEEMKSA